MKREITPPSKKLLIVYRVEVAVICVLVLVLAAGSLYAFIRAMQGRNSGAASSGRAGGETAMFSGIGRLRIPVTGPAAMPATVILSVSFPYPANDRPFAEELASRIGDFRSIATGYFSALPAERINRLDEEAAKTEILRRYNALLRLGQIENLYFTDFNVIE